MSGDQPLIVNRVYIETQMTFEKIFDKAIKSAKRFHKFNILNPIETVVLKMKN